MEHARGTIQYRQRIPAFGEWNYDHGVDDWSVLSQRFESPRMMQIPFPLHKQPCRKRAARAGRRRRSVRAFGEWNNDHIDGNGEGGSTAAVNQCLGPAVVPHKQVRDDNGIVAMGMQQHKAWVADSRHHVAMEPFSFTVVEAVDDDLYEVPADMLCSKSMRRRSRTWLRSLLTRCFGLNCFG